MSKIETLTTEQRNLLFDLTRVITNSKFKDPLNPPTTKEVAQKYGKNMSDLYKPEAYDYSNPETLALEHWHQYILSAALHGTPKNQKQTTHHDTSKQRRKTLTRMVKLMGNQPSTEYLKTKFQLPEAYDEVCEIIDEDIKSLI